MKRIAYAGFLIILALSSYLFFAYTRIYRIIGKENLKSPYQENRVILENPAGQGSAKYVVLGDSLSAGVGSAKVEETFPYLYAKKLSQNYQNVELVNLASPGATTVEVIDKQLLSALEENPDFITLLVGINDLHNHVSSLKFTANYKIILDTLLQGTEAKILVINLPYLGSNKLVYPPFNTTLNFKTREFNKTIASLIDSDRIKMVDLYANVYTISQTDSDYYASDNFHPSGKGYILWSRIINAN